MSEVCGRVGLRGRGDRGGGRGKEKRLSPHDLHVGVVLSSEEVVAAVGPHHVFVHRELDLPPELAVFLRAHGQPEETQKKKNDILKLVTKILITPKAGAAQNHL